MPLVNGLMRLFWGHSKLCSSLVTKAQYDFRCWKKSELTTSCSRLGTRVHSLPQEPKGRYMFMLECQHLLMCSQLNWVWLLTVFFSERRIFSLVQRVTLLQVFSILRVASTRNTHPSHIHTHPNEQNLILLEEKKSIWSFWKNGANFGSKYVGFIQITQNYNWIYEFWYSIHVKAELFISLDR